MKVDETRLSSLLEKDQSSLDVLDVRYLVEAGVWKPAAAEAWAKKSNRHPFARIPSAEIFDPLAERYWSILMTIAWIMGRNADAVRRCWRLYLSLCYEWQAQAPNPDFPDRFPYELRHPYPNTYSTYSMNPAINETLAVSLLRSRLESGVFTATGLNKDGIRKFIDVLEWCDLSFYYAGIFYDEAIEAIDGAMKLNSNEDLFANWIEGNYEYTRIMLKVSEVTKEFPANATANVTDHRLTFEEARLLLTREIGQRGGFIDQAAAAELVRRIDPTFKRDSVRSLVKSLTGNEKRGPRSKRTLTATEKGEKSSSA